MSRRAGVSRWSVSDSMRSARLQAGARGHRAVKRNRAKGQLVFRVRVYENAHYQDEEEAYDLQERFDADGALARARAIVDSNLSELGADGLSGEALFHVYRNFGDDPVIGSLGPAAPPPFSAWAYAKAQCGLK
jgi:hypothetical protein